MHSSLPGSGNDVYVVRLARCQVRLALSTCLVGGRCPGGAKFGFALRRRSHLGRFARAQGAAADHTCERDADEMHGPYRHEIRRS